MVGEGVEGDLGGRMLVMFSGIRNFKMNGSKRNKTGKESSFFFFFSFKDIVSLAWYSYNSNIEFCKRQLESTKIFLYKCLAVLTLSCEELEHKEKKGKNWSLIFNLNLDLSN